MHVFGRSLCTTCGLDIRALGSQSLDIVLTSEICIVKEEVSSTEAGVGDQTSDLAAEMNVARMEEVTARAICQAACATVDFHHHSSCPHFPSTNRLSALICASRSIACFRLFVIPCLNRSRTLAMAGRFVRSSKYRSLAPAAVFLARALNLSSHRSRIW